MAQIVLDVPAAQVGRVVDAMCKAGGYRGDPADDAARRAFTRQMLATYVRSVVATTERTAALATAGVAVDPVDVS